jgi:hypothetical protein
MSSVLGVALSGVILYVALVGLGFIVRRWVLRAAADGALDDAVGVGAALAAGGVLSLLHLVGRVSYAALLLVGLAGWAARHRLAAKQPPSQWLPAIVGALCLAPAWLQTAAGRQEFNVADDYRAYLVAPEQLLQLGHYVADPFNFRLTMSTLGGMPFLQAGLRTLVRPESLYLVDVCIGGTLLIRTSLWLMRRWSVEPAAGAALLAGTLLLAPARIVNLTSVYTSASLLLALFAILIDVRRLDGARLGAASLVVAGIGALKVTFAPTAGLLLVLALIAAFRAHALRGRAAAVSLLAGLAIVLVWLAPRLGHPVHVVPFAWGHQPDQVNAAEMASWFFDQPVHWAPAAICALLGALGLARGRGRDDQPSTACWLVATLVGGLATFVFSGGAAQLRYTQPIVCVAYLVFALRLVALTRSRSWRAALPAVLAVSFVGFGGDRHDELVVLRELPPRLAMVPSLLLARVAPLPVADARQALEQAQARMVEPGALLVRVEEPFLLDFTRRPIFVMDHPCAVSPAPGIPCDGRDVEALRSYLRAQSIRYVLFGAKRIPLWLWMSHRWSPPILAWTRSLNSREGTLWDSFQRLAARSRVLYDQDGLILIELAS